MRTRLDGLQVPSGPTSTLKALRLRKPICIIGFWKLPHLIRSLLLKKISQICNTTFSFYKQGNWPTKARRFTLYSRLWKGHEIEAVAQCFQVANTATHNALSVSGQRWRAHTHTLSSFNCGTSVSIRGTSRTHRQRGRERPFLSKLPAPPSHTLREAPSASQWPHRSPSH